MEQITIDKKFLVGFALGGMLYYVFIGLIILMCFLIGFEELAPLIVIISSGILGFWCIHKIGNYA